MSRRKKSQQFQPDFHDLERRMMPATFVVTSTTDPATLTSGTLRWAVEQANAATTPSTINFDLGSSPQTITLTQGQLELTNTADSVAIDRPGANLLDISGNSASRVFDVESGVTASLSGLSISEGLSQGAIGLGGRKRRRPVELGHRHTLRMHDR